LRGFWERKVREFENGDPNLFRSEYAFDSTGFESTEAIARYALLHADAAGAAEKPVIPPANARRFLESQMAANVFCRGSIEPAYYYLGSDYRGSAGNAYTLSYMSQMGGWAVLDYGLNFATNPSPYLRLGYASILSSWALMNSGTAASNYGYWYPGKANDGGAGGGFEPAPYGMTWLGQPHHRGSWYYACEIDLGFCGALRAAATIVTDDPLFGRFCLGGELRAHTDSFAITPRDGVRRRFHAVLQNASFHFVSDVDHFPEDPPLLLKDDLSEFRFRLESDNRAAHIAAVRLSGPAGRYTLDGPTGRIATFELTPRQETAVAIPIEAGAGPHAFVLRRQAAD
jgi:hypothetical protein